MITFFFHIFTLVSGWGPRVTPFVGPTETISFTSRCSDPGFQVDTIWLFVAVRHGKSQFFIGKLWKITIFDGKTMENHHV